MIADPDGPPSADDEATLREMAIERLRAVALAPGEHATLTIHRGGGGSFSAQVDVPDPSCRRRRICLTVQVRR